MKTLYLLIGPMGAGKTTWTHNNFSDNPNAIRISQDDMGREGHRICFQKAVEGQKQIIIIDRINHVFKQRHFYTAAARQFGYKIVYVKFAVDREVCLKRMKDRKDHPTISPDAEHELILSTFYDHYDKIHHSEYDEIVHVDANGVCKEGQVCNSQPNG